MEKIILDIYKGDLYQIQQAAKKIGSTVNDLIYDAAVDKANAILRKKANQKPLDKPE